MVDQVPRVPPDVADRLINELELAFGTPPQPGKERKPLIDALVAMARFARAAGSLNAMWALTERAYELQDLDAGRVAPVFKSTKPKGAPPDRSLMWMKRARVLVAMNALQQADPSLKLVEAAKHIAENYPGLEGLLTRGKDLPGAILHWRRELDKAKPGEFLAQFSEQMVDMENVVAQQSLSPVQLRQFAHKTLERI